MKFRLESISGDLPTYDPRVTQEIIKHEWTPKLHKDAFVTQKQREEYEKPQTFETIEFFIELGTLEEVLVFCEENKGRIVIETRGEIPILEIYDGWRE